MRLKLGKICLGRMKLSSLADRWGQAVIAVLRLAPGEAQKERCHADFPPHSLPRTIWKLKPEGVARAQRAAFPPSERVVFMRIAQIAPLFEAVPPKLYGGTERVVSALTEELVAMGHEVTLFASGDSVTSAKLDAPWPQALRLDPNIRDWVATYHLMLEYVYTRREQFDILHFHIDYFPNSLFSSQPIPFVTTLHGRLDLPEFGAVYRMFPDVPLVSISSNQRKPVPELGWVATVLHGMPAERLMPQPHQGERDYFAFLGRISPEKGIERAIR